MNNRFFRTLKTDAAETLSTRNIKQLNRLKLIILLFVVLMSNVIKSDKEGNPPATVWLSILFLLYNFYQASKYEYLPVHQAGLLNNISRYLELTAKKDSSLEATKKTLEVGHCYALNLIHGTMSVMGKLDWWENVLIKMTNWDGKLESLYEEVVLPNSDSKYPVLLKDIFKRALNYIIFFQGYLPGIQLFMAYPYQFLTKLEILDQGEIKKVKSLSVASGNFTREQLNLLLHEDQIKNSLCLIESSIHSVTLQYDAKNSEWMVYDPNYVHTSKYTIHETFPTKKAAIEELFLRLGEEVNNIYIAHFSPYLGLDHLDKQYRALIPKYKYDLIKDYGFHSIAKNLPEDLIVFIDNLDKKNVEHQSLIKNILESLNLKIFTTQYTGFATLLAYQAPYLPQILELIRNEKQATQIILNCLLQKNLNKWTGLHLVAACSPQNLARVLDFIKDEKEAAQTISQLLPETNSTEQSVLYFIAENASNDIPRILDFIKHEPKAKQSILAALKNGAFHNVAQFAKKHLGTVLDFIQDEKNAPQVILNCLSEKKPDILLEKRFHKWTGLHYVARYAPKHLTQILKVIKDEKESAKTIARLLSVTNNSNENVLSLIADYSPEQIPEILHFISKDPDAKQSVLEALKNGTFKRILQANEQLDKVLSFIQDEKNAPRVVLNCLEEKAANNRNRLHIAIIDFPQQLPKILNFIKVEENAGKFVLNSLAAKIHEKPVIHLLLQYAPDAVTTVLDIIKNEPDAAQIIRQSLAERSLDSSSWGGATVSGWDLAGSNAPKHVVALAAFVNEVKLSPSPKK